MEELPLASSGAKNQERLDCEGSTEAEWFSRGKVTLGLDWEHVVMEGG